MATLHNFSYHAHVEKTGKVQFFMMLFRLLDRIQIRSV